MPYKLSDEKNIKGHVEHWCCCDCNHAFADDQGTIDLGETHGDRQQIDLIDFDWDEGKVGPNGEKLYELVKDCKHLIIGNFTKYSSEIEALVDPSSCECGKKGYIDLATCHLGTKDGETYAYIVSDYVFAFDPVNDFQLYKFANMNCVTITIENVDTSGITDFSSFFNGNNSLKQLDISCFDTSSCEDFSYMFAGFTNLETIIATDNFSCESGEMNIDAMFKDCDSLTGGLDSTVTDVKDYLVGCGFEEEEAATMSISGLYAKIDGGLMNDDPGYFTAPQE